MTEQLRIGISALHRASGGSLTHLAHLLDDWKRDGTLARHRFVIFAGPDSDAALRQAVPGLAEHVEIVLFPAAGRGLLRRLIDEQVALPRALKKHSIDVLLCPANVMPWSGVTAARSLRNGHAPSESAGPHRR